MEKYIEDCLISIVNQIDINKSDFEVIVVNDGSKDNTSNIVKEFISNNTYNITIIDKEHEGVSIARNTGLYAAKGDFVWFIDPDDCISNDALKYIIDTIKSFKIQLILIGQLILNVLQTDGIFKNYQDTQRIPSSYKIVPAYEIYVMKNYFNHTMFIWKREFLISNNLHYPENITNNEDFFFLMKAIYKADEAYINSTYQFYYYRELIESASRTKNKFDRIDRFMRNRYILLNELSKMYQNTKDSKSKRDKCFNAKFIEFQAQSVSVLLRSGTPLYFIKYYLRELTQLGCYPLTTQMMNTLNYYYPIFNIRIIFYVISVINRLNNISTVKKWTKKVFKKCSNTKP